MIRGKVMGVVLPAPDVPEYAFAAGCPGSMNTNADTASAAPAKK